MDSLLEILQNMSYTAGLVFWFSMVFFFAILEFCTAALVAVWFVFGALGALIALVCGGTFLTQLMVFLVVSVLSFVTMRSFAVSLLDVKEVPTNVDSIVGMQGIVITTIDNIRTEGRAKVNGLEWAARSATGEVIPQDTIIVVRNVEGVSLTVEAIK